MKFDNIDELYEHIKQECLKSLNNVEQKFYKEISQEDKEQLDKLIEIIMDNKTITNDSTTNDYCIAFSDNESLDSFMIKVKQVDRPNGADDFDVIQEYILNNYGYKDYEIIELDTIEKVILQDQE